MNTSTLCIAMLCSLSFATGVHAADLPPEEHKDDRSLRNNDSLDVTNKRPPLQTILHTRLTPERIIHEVEENGACKHQPNSLGYTPLEYYQTLCNKLLSVNENPEVIAAFKNAQCSCGQK